MTTDGNQTFTILHLEDDEADARLVAIALKRTGVPVELEVVNTKEAYLEALQERTPDAILADMRIPSFGGAEALAIARAEYPQVPFILVSGAIGEEEAVDTLKNGATDFVLKGNLVRLDPVVKRAIREAEAMRLSSRLTQKLAEYHVRWASILESMPAGFFGLDRDYRITIANDVLGRLTGEPRDALRGQFLWDLFPEARDSAFHDTYEQVFTDGTPRESEAYYDPLKCWFEVYAFPAGEGIAVYFRDTTQSHLDRAERERTSALYQAVVEQIPAITYVISGSPKERHTEYISPQLEAILGISPDRWRADPRLWASLVHPDDLELAETSHQRTFANGTRLDVIYRMQDATGDWHWISDQARAISQGGETLVQGVMLDMTERAEMEVAIEESEHRFRSLVQGSNDVIAIIGPDGIVNYISPAVEKIGGFSPEEIIGSSGLGFIHPDDRDAASRALSLLVERGPGEEEDIRARALTQDGGWIWIDIKARNLLDDPSINGIVINYSDITERMEHDNLERQLRQAQKLEAIGRLAGGLAHDFNNLLAVIVNYSTFLEEDLAPEHRKLEDVREIKRAAEKGVALTRQVLTFSRTDPGSPKVLDVNSTVHEVEGLLKRSIGEDINLKVQCSENLWPVAMDPGHLEQVLMNLSLNARDAMPGGGTIGLKTWNQAAHGPSNGSKVMIEVSDEGIGMSDEIQSRLFEPFFTTKPMGRGTGLGLATAYGIVRQAGGTIEVESAEGKGSTFRVAIPRSDRPQRREQEMAPEPPAAGGTESIMLVEDEDSVRRSIERILREAGYGVRSAESAATALGILDDGFRPAVVLTDVVMPKTSGPELSEALRERGSRAKVLFMSGYGGDALVERGLTHGARAVLQKPFTKSQLLKRIRETIESASGNSPSHSAGSGVGLSSQ